VETPTMRMSLTLIIFLALVVGCVWVVRSRKVGVLLSISMLMASACLVAGGLFVESHSPECLLPGGVLAAGGVVALSVCTVALVLWAKPGGEA
jgi:hypothetical protein